MHKLLLFTVKQQKSAATRTAIIDARQAVMAGLSASGNFKIAVSGGNAQSRAEQATCRKRWVCIKAQLQQLSAGQSVRGVVV